MHRQNGVAERVIRTLEGRVLAMLHVARLPLVYWGKAMLTASYLHATCGFGAAEPLHISL